MPKSTKTLRQEWFDRGAEAVARNWPDAQRCYVCPLCTRAFLPAALDHDLLTLDHVPPESLGGRLLVLTCRECNSRAGHQLDTEMLAMEQVFDFAQGRLTRTHRGRLAVGELNPNIEFRAVGDHVRIEILPDRRNNKPGTTEAVKELLGRLAQGDAWQGFSFTLSSVETFHYQRALVGWLRAAYLVAFALLGYSYVRRPELRIVRDQLTDSTTLLNVFSMTDTASPTDTRHVVLIEEPEWLRDCLAIQMGRHCVLLPALDSRLHLYDRLAANQQQHDQVQIKGSTLPWPARPQFLLDFRAP